MNEPQNPTNPDPTNPTPTAMGNEPPATPPEGDPNQQAGQEPAGSPDPQAGQEPTATSFLESLPEDIRGNERFKDIESVEDLAKRYAEAKFAPTVPGADEYTLPEGVPKEFGEAANKLGLTQEQFDGALGTFAQFDQSRNVAIQQGLQSAAQQLIESWGEKGKENLLIAKRALRFEDESGELLKLLESTGYGNHPVVIKHFFEKGLKLQEGGFINSMPNTPHGRKSAAATLYPNLTSKET